jgi:DNA invertase Pin-like site-specific DNA recombinase
VRTYKRKRVGVWRNKDKRMAAAVRLRAEGLSLRQIADQLAIGLGTVHRDLARWEREHSNVTLLPFQNPVPTSPVRGALEQPGGTVTAIRRTS